MGIILFICLFVGLISSGPNMDEYVFISGSKLYDQSPVYGTQNTFDGGSSPGSRIHPVTMKHPISGTLLMIYGEHNDGFQTYSYCAGPDWWEFDYSQSTGQEWRWLARRTRVDDSEANACEPANLNGDILPPGRALAAGFTVGTAIYIMGGWGAQADYPSEDRNDIWMYDFNEGSPQWKKMIGSEVLTPSETRGTSKQFSSTFHPNGKRYHNIVVDPITSNYVYILFGYAKTANLVHNDLWIYDTVTNEYAWVMGDSNYVVFASNDYPAFPAEYNVFDPLTEPRPRCAGAVYAVGEMMYVYSGSSGLLNAEEPRAYYYDMYVYNITLGQWAALMGGTSIYVDPTYPSVLATFEDDTVFPGARVGNAFWNDPHNPDYLWLFAGYFKPGGQHKTVSDLWVYSISRNLWTQTSGCVDSDCSPVYTEPENMGGSFRLQLNSVYFTDQYTTVVIGGHDNSGNLDEVWGVKHYSAAICSDKDRFDADVCSGFGWCIEPDVCVCTTDGYFSLDGDCIQCPTGAYCASGVKNLCPAGTWSDTLGASLITTCTDCLAGTWSVLEGATLQTDCQDCPAGEWSSALGATSCTECGQGTWSDTVGASDISTCTACAIGTFSTATARTSSCDLCPFDTYQDGTGQSTCTACPDGETTLSTGSDELTDCQDLGCTDGQYAAAGSCHDCPEGTYGNIPVRSTCNDCPAGTWSSATAATSIATCTDCGMGKWSDTLGATLESTCVLCPVGTWSDQTGLAASSECYNCGAGKFNANEGSQSNVCLSCGFGTWSDALATDACTPCGVGNHNPNTGSMVIGDCQPCPAGTASNSASVEYCADCLAGTFTATTGQTTCTACTMPEYAEGTANTGCSTCTPGTYNNGDTAVSDCQPCPQYNCATCSGGGGSDCTSCSSGYLVGGHCCDMDFCLDCSADETQCANCDGTHYVDASGTKCCAMDNCDVCAVETTCTDCSFDFYWTGALCDDCHVNCDDCSGPNANQCLACTSGATFQDNAGYCCDMANCYDCAGDIALCTTCDNGYHGDDSASCTQCTQTNCLDCDGGLANDCVNCGAFFNVNGYCCEMDNCVNCIGSRAICTTCDIGYYGDGLAACSECTQTNCVDCDGGLVNDCVDCGAFFNVNGYCCEMDNCLNCVDNRGICATCDTGYHGDTTDTCTLCTQTNCLDCDGGLANDCVDCGAFYDVNGYCCTMNNCLDCIDNRAICTTCDTNYYGDTTSTCTLCTQTNCLDCDGGLANDCVDCGAFFDVNGYCCEMDNCLDCIDNRAICTTCDNGYYGDGLAACSECTQTNCLDCDGGLVDDCVDCGLFFNVNGYCCEMDNCLNCVDNRGICATCDIGYHGDTTSSCTLCTQTNCLDCDGGLANDCVDCGAFYDVNGYCCTMDNCLDCIDNRAICTTCDNGYHGDMSSSCTLCTQTNCLDCDGGLANDCVDCGAYFNVNGYCCEMDNCLDCIGSRAICTTCDTNYYGDTESTCTLCTQPNCLDCDGGLVDDCVDCGAFFNVNGYCCEMDNCLNCVDNRGICTTCDNGYYGDGLAACSECTQTNCVDCDGGLVDDCVDCGLFFNVNGYCCEMENCLDCIDNRAICTTCDTNYYGDTESSCTLCTQTNCLDCDGGLVNDCVDCGLFFNVNGYCCEMDNCVNCISDRALCTTCDNGYYGDGLAACSECTQTNCLDCDGGLVNDCVDCGLNHLVNGYCCEMDNCNDCIGSRAICSECDFGYHGDTTDTCTLCTQTNCLDCDGGLVDDCVDCGVFFNVNGYCCEMDNCLNCVDNRGICATCDNGYHGDTTSSCTQCTQTNCLDCDGGSVNDCVDCGAFYDVNGYCCTMDNCLDCIDNRAICTTCDTGYHGDSTDTCSLCTQTNCLDCDGGLANDCVNCGAFFDVNGYCCEMENCLDCIDNRAICTTCDTNYYGDTTSSCTQCTQTNCLDCDGDLENDCVDCGLFFNVNGYCCEMDNCLNCVDNRGICATCDIGYHGDTTSSCTHCTQTNCVDCDGGLVNDCVDCGAFYDVNGYCCTMDNCLDCIDNRAICTTCDNGYHGDMSSSCTLCTQTNCVDCDGGLVNDCVDCGLFFNINGYCCEMDNCLDCIDSRAICTTCDTNYYGDTESTCTLCTQTNCLDCDGGLVDDCVDCGAFFNVNGYCCEMDNCLNCVDDRGICTTCDNGYYGDGLAACSECTQTNCVDCDGGLVDDCVDCGLFFNVNGYCCEMENCLDCIDNRAICTTCDTNYYGDTTSSCTQCTQTNCLDCDGDLENDCVNCGAFFNVNGYCCEMDNCADCISNRAVCTTCDNGYYGDGLAACSECTQTNCLDCDGGLVNDCVDCGLNHLVNGYCCEMDNCNDCIGSRAICSECDFGYQGDTTDTCTQCTQTNCLDCDGGLVDDCVDCGAYFNVNGYCCEMENCLNCVDNRGICATCDNGYHGDTTSSCTLCTQTNCLDCDGGLANDCVDCGAFYDVNGYCCEMNNCLDCIDNRAICTTCDTNYHGDTTSTCTLCTQTNCLDCDGELANDCVDCGAFFDVNGYCCEMDNCLDCIDNRAICTTCDTNYYGDTESTCTLCTQTNCLDCDGGLVDDCVDCGTYFNVNGYCCEMDNCLNCVDNRGICATCDNGYYGDGLAACSECTQTNCVDCDGGLVNDCVDCGLFFNVNGYCCEMENCLDCIDNRAICSTCDTNYYGDLESSCTQCTQTNCIDCDGGLVNDCVDCGLFFNVNGYCCEMDNCVDCIDSRAICTTCDNGYHGDNSDTCTLCTQTNCLDCDGGLVNDCVDCGAFFNVNGYCCEMDNCLDCISNRAECTTCDNGYYGDGTGTCSECTQTNCLDCDGELANDCVNCGAFFDVNGYCCEMNNCLDCMADRAVCSDCDFDFYWDEVSTCASCHSNCDDCTGPNANQCVACSGGGDPLKDNAGYCCDMLNCFDCSGNSAICTTCDFGYWGDGTSSCTACTQYDCEDCSGENDGECEVCEYGFLVSGYCCGMGYCSDCSVSENLCETCDPGNFLSSTRTRCCDMQYCDTCATESVCTDCSYGYYWDGSTSCLPCPQTDCLDCSGGNNGQCTVCSGGSFIDTIGYCCEMEFCDDCSTSLGTCDGCAGTHYIDQSGTKCCEMGNCDVCSNIAICDTCSVGFFGDTTDTCAACTQTGCSDCNSGALGDCVLCGTGVLLNGYCCAMDNCADCSGGSGVGVCVTCADGYYGDNSASCTLCEDGDCKECPGSGTGICTECFTGNLVNNYCCNMANCIDCAADRMICTTCDTGYSGSGTGTCSDCDDDGCNYCTGTPGTGLCTDCIGSRFLTPDPGPGYCCHIENCDDCSANVLSCATCTIDHYWTGSLCAACPQPNCVDCTGPSNAECLACVGGPSFRDNLDNCCDMANCFNCDGNVAVCTTCDNGYYGDGSGTCTQCTQTNCLDCNGGNDNDCVDCGLFFNVDGYCCEMDNCVDCIADRAVCGDCDFDFYWTGTTCSSCHPNCEDCSGPLANECVACVNGESYKDNAGYCCDMTDCFDCSAISSICTTCDSGYFGDGEGVCTQCTQTNCLDCDGGLENDCVDCGAFFDVNGYCCEMNNCLDCTADRAVCSDCDYDFYWDAVSSCVPCHSNCDDCSGPSASDCVSCSGGATFQDENGNCCDMSNCFNCSGEVSVCTDCNIGYYTTGGVVCAQCPQENCVDCDGGNEDDCIDCGAFFNTNGYCCEMDNCLDCNFNRAICDDCDLDYYWNGNSCSQCHSNCDQCDGPNANDCISCASNEAYEDSTGFCCDMEYCDDCGSTVDVCETCILGHYGDGTSSCVPCPEGTWSAEGGMDIDSCISCVAGTWSNVVGATSVDDCQKCLPGKWSDTTGATSSDTCVDCDAGTFSNVEGAALESACQDCPLGSFNNVPGASECQNCSSGTYTNRTGSVTVDECILCSYGEYCIAGVKFDCAFYEYTSAEGSSSQNSCTSCLPGFEVNGERKGCSECPTNQFSTGNSVCQCCPAGRQPSLGRSDCSPCPEGQVVSDDCELCQCCLAGTYRFDGSSCKECDAGTTSSDCSDVCNVCPRGYFEENNDCKECPENFYCQSGLLSDIWRCFKILKNSSNVCSNHGSCIEPDVCSCDSNWDLVNDCSLTSCGGVPSNSSKVCSERGNCTDFNRCDCVIGTSGGICEHFYDEPTISVDYVEVVGACSESIITAQCEGHDVSFEWYSNMTDVIVEMDSNTVVMPVGVSPGTYQFSVFCVDFWGRPSNEVSFSVEKVDFDVPTSFVSPEEITVFPNDASAKFEGFGETTCSATSQGDYIFRWEQIEPISNPIDFTGIDLSSGQLIFANGFPVIETEHYIQFSVSSPLSDVESSATVVVHVVLKELVPLLNDSSRSVPLGYEIAVSGEGSYDPNDVDNEVADVEYIWNLVFICGNGTELEVDFGDEHNSVISFAAWDVGRLVLDFTFKKGERSNSIQLIFDTFILPQIEDPYVPLIWIESFQFPVNPSEKIVVTGRIEEHEKSHLVEFLWECVGECDGVNPLENSIASENLNSLVLVLLPNVLKSSSMFKLNAFYGDVSVFATQIININDGGPTSGTVSIYPMENYVFEDFQINFADWVDNSPPLKYSVHFAHCITNQKKIVKDWTADSSFAFSISTQGCRMFDYEIDLIVQISDFYGSTTAQTHKVKVYPVDYENIIEFIVFVNDLVTTSEKSDRETMDEFFSTRLDLFFQVYNLRSPNCSSLSLQEQLCFTIEECRSTDVLESNFLLFSQFQINSLAFLIDYFPDVIAADVFNSSVIELFKYHLEVLHLKQAQFVQSGDLMEVTKRIYQQILFTDFKHNLDLYDISHFWDLLHLFMKVDSNLTSREIYVYSKSILEVLLKKLVYQERNVYLLSSDAVPFSFIKDYASLYKENSKLRITGKTLELFDMKVKIPNEIASGVGNSLYSIINSYGITLNSSLEIGVFFSDEFDTLHEIVELVDTMSISFPVPEGWKNVRSQGGWKNAIKCYQSSLISFTHLHEEEELCNEVEIDSSEESIICKCNLINALYRIGLEIVPPKPQPRTGGKKSNVGAVVAGILTGVFFLVAGIVGIAVAIIVLFTVFYVRRRRRKMAKVLPIAKGDVDTTVAGSSSDEQSPDPLAPEDEIFDISDCYNVEHDDDSGQHDGDVNDLLDTLFVPENHSDGTEVKQEMDMDNSKMSTDELRLNGQGDLINSLRMSFELMESFSEMDLQKKEEEEEASENSLKVVKTPPPCRTPIEWAEEEHGFVEMKKAKSDVDDLCALFHNDLGHDEEESNYSNEEEDKEISEESERGQPDQESLESGNENIAFLKKSVHEILFDDKKENE